MKPRSEPCPMADHVAKRSRADAVEAGHKRVPLGAVLALLPPPPGCRTPRVALRCWAGVRRATMAKSVGLTLRSPGLPPRLGLAHREEDDASSPRLPSRPPRQGWLSCAQVRGNRRQRTGASSAVPVIAFFVLGLFTWAAPLSERPRLWLGGGAQVSSSVVWHRCRTPARWGAGVPAAGLVLSAW